jgi:hypothetical protein
LQFGWQCPTVSLVSTIHLDVGPETAKKLLASLENEIAQRIQGREKLDAEIDALEVDAKSIRSQLQETGATTPRAPQGGNKDKIRAYLSGLPDGKGATYRHCRSTKVSFHEFHFDENTKDFEKDDKEKLWKLKSKAIRPAS